MTRVVGVDITTSLRAGPSNPVGPVSARFYAAGITERGPIDKTVRVTSIAGYESVFGARTAYAGALYDTAQTFFEEGGAELYPCRVVGPAATTGTLVIKDRTVAAPPDTLSVTAVNPGAWSADLSVAVVAGAAPNSVTLTVFYAGTLVGTYPDHTSVAELAAAMASSAYVRGLDMGSPSAYPTRLPALTALTPLPAGTDDRAAVTAALTAAALALAGRALGPGVVAAPGFSATQVGAPLIAHAKANRRLALLAGATDSDDTELISMAAALTADGEYAALIGPSVLIRDGSGTRKISPEGYVAGVRARVQNAEGFWQLPAGLRSVSRFLVGPARVIDPAGNDTLAVGRVSGILTIGGDTELYGWRSLSTNTEQFALASARDTLNAIESLVETTLEPYVFATIDGRGQLLGEIQGALSGALQPIASAGGLYARLDEKNKELDPGYRVQVDPTIIGDQIIATISVRLAPAAELISVSIVKAALGAGV